MITLWQIISINVFDVLLGWLLWLPRDASVVVLGVLSAILAVWIRRFVCDRQLLALIRQDQRVLRRLIRDARRAGDQASLARHRRVRAAVARRRFSQELRALAVMAAPLLALAPWAAARLDYVPPRENETVALVAWLPASSIGETIHLVPLEGVDAADGWIRSISRSQQSGQTRGRAEWQIRAASRTTPYQLLLRFRDNTLQHDMLVGQSTYASPLQIHGDDTATELQLRRYAPLGIEKLTHLGAPPWLLAYLVVTLAAALTFDPFSFVIGGNSQSNQIARGSPLRGVA
jgi:hypothetical protein